MQNEAITVGVPATLYLDLAYQLRKSDDMRAPEQVVALAIKHWMAGRSGKAAGLGYQWKNLFLPDGTDLRLRYRGVCYYASVKGDQLVYADEPVSPREWTLLVTGGVRNPWRDIWIRHSAAQTWTRASDWRTRPAERLDAPDGERRRLARRSTD
jgi:hypothetical protein